MPVAVSIVLHWGFSILPVLLGSVVLAVLLGSVHHPIAHASHGSAVVWALLRTVRNIHRAAVLGRDVGLGPCEGYVFSR
jgi:hypothetical protein